MVTFIEIIANLIIIIFMMIIIGLLSLTISVIAHIFGANFKSFFRKSLWFTLLAPILFCYGFFIERNQCQVKKIEIESDEIPASFNDYKIVQISDLHLHSFKNRAKTLQKFVNEINEQKADIVVFTGDLVSYGPWELEVKDTPEIDLMLSGHTHAMQFSLFGWSPSSFIFNEVAGLFKHNEQYLYVNIGLGETLMKTRIGTKPEITVIELIMNNVETH